MTGGSLPRRYARALFDLAGEEGALEPFGHAMESVARLFATSPEALEAMANRSFPLEQRLKVVAEVSTRLGLPETVGRFLAHLLKKERIALLPQIAREFEKLRDEALGILRATVTAPTVPEKELLEKVERLLSLKTKKKVLASARADSELIGGLTVEIDHTVYDGSVRREMERIRERMTQEG